MIKGFVEPFKMLMVEKLSIPKSIPARYLKSIGTSKGSSLIS